MRKTPLDLKSCYLPMVNGLPFVMVLSDAPELFALLFTSEEKLHVTVQKVKGVMGVQSYQVQLVTKVSDLAQIFLDHHIKLMVDPLIIGDKRTAWQEIIQDQGHLYLLSKD